MSAAEDTEVIRVVAGIIEQQGRLLVCQRRRGGLFELQWEFPGGKLRASETPRAGLARELHEELGSVADIGRELWRTVYHYREIGAPTEVRFFRVCQLFPVPRNLAFERMLWVPPEALPRYEFLAADRELVARLMRKALQRSDRTL
jgi:mutator protein MutT